ncbi:hypothetical protein RHOER0001_0907 [Rhodococcus erythropolis SK121]|nr:hypothetical protein RHOER0001_0907 [Rhodococcus erythropolis SK121]
MLITMLRLMMIPPKVRIVLAKPTVIPLFRAAISPFIVVSPSLSTGYAYKIVRWR